MMPSMSPQQQMEFMAMMEQQARMMAQFTGMVPGGMSPSGFQQNGQQTNGQQGSLFDRVQAPGRGGSWRQRTGKRLPPKWCRTKRSYTGLKRCRHRVECPVVINGGGVSLATQKHGPEHNHVQVQQTLHQPRLPLCPRVSRCARQHRHRHDRHVQLRCCMQKLQMHRKTPIASSAESSPRRRGLQILSQLCQPRLQLQTSQRAAVPQWRGLHQGRLHIYPSADDVQIQSVHQPCLPVQARRGPKGQGALERMGQRGSEEGERCRYGRRGRRSACEQPEVCGGRG